MTQEETQATATPEQGIDYGPDFDQDVGAVLKTRLLAAITTYRDAELQYAIVNARFMELGDRWSNADTGRVAARDELIKASGAWETWERQQLRNTPQTPQEAPGRAEAPKPDEVPAFGFGTHGIACYTVACDDPECYWRNGRHLNDG